MTDSRTPTALIVGASRGLGHAMAAEFLGRGWDVVGTVRDPTTRTPLHDLADRSSGRLEVEHLDINQPAQLAPLHDRLAARQLDRLAARQLDRLAAGQTDRIRTGLGGPEAPFTMEETVPRVVDVLLSRRGSRAWHTSPVSERPCRGDRGGYLRWSVIRAVEGRSKADRSGLSE
jgi:NAD(P)-dependent dehydrogenase (short-subunit alcohol dehydrogenase family)